MHLARQQKRKSVNQAEISVPPAYSGVRYPAEFSRRNSSCWSAGRPVTLIPGVGVAALSSGG